MFAKRVFTMAFTIFLAERFYNVFTLFSFYKYFFTLIQGSYTMFPRSLFILFTMYIHGKMGVAGSPLFIRYEFLFFSKVYLPATGIYLYYSLLRQGISLILLGKGG